ncbi:hypothetical protein ECG_06221 [Echinococcus granulosus]|nr:hypothetical protein ECG_06221 [Echinococcus granulosus]
MQTKWNQFTDHPSPPQQKLRGHPLTDGGNHTGNTRHVVRPVSTLWLWKCSSLEHSTPARQHDLWAMPMDLSSSVRLEELLDEENVAPNAPSGSPREKSGDEKRVLETVIFAQEDEAGHLAEVKEMLKNNDPRLKFVLDGDAIENPFAAD